MIWLICMGVVFFRLPTSAKWNAESRSVQGLKYTCECDARNLSSSHGTHPWDISGISDDPDPPSFQVQWGNTACGNRVPELNIQFFWCFLLFKSLRKVFILKIALSRTRQLFEWSVLPGILRAFTKERVIFDENEDSFLVGASEGNFIKGVTFLPSSIILFFFFGALGSQPHFGRTRIRRIPPTLHRPS